jgi:hypothetical protein
VAFSVGLEKIFAVSAMRAGSLGKGVHLQQAARVSDRTAFFNLAGVGKPGRLIEYRLGANHPKVNSSWHRNAPRSSSRTQPGVDPGSGPPADPLPEPLDPDISVSHH